MLKQRWIIILILLLLIFNVGKAIASISAESIIQEIQSRVSQINTFKCDMNMYFQMMGKEFPTDGRIYFKQPEYFRMEMTTTFPMKTDQIMISDGNTLWQYIPQMNMVTKIDVKKISHELGKENKYFSQQNIQTGDLRQPFRYVYEDTIKYIGKEDLDGIPVYVLEAEPKSVFGPGKTDQSKDAFTTFTIKKLKIWIGAHDGIVRKQEMYDENGNKLITHLFKNIEINIDISDNLFEFTPPQGAQIMDLTEETINMFREMQKTQEGRK